VTVCLILFIPIRYLSIFSSVAIAVGLYLTFLGFRVLACKFSLLTIRSSRIRRATRGLVEVSGVVDGPHTTLAPITGEPCFLYRTTAWQHCEGTRNEWEKVADETLHLPFFIKDSTGQLLIEATGADLELHPQFRREYVVTLLDEVPSRVGVFLSRHGLAMDRDLCVEECLIKAEDTLFVAGTVAENPGVQVRSSSPRRGDNPHYDLRSHYGPGSAQDDSAESFPAPQIVRLSSGAAPSSTREMSQQSKIAAALARAGTTTPQVWSTEPPSHRSVTIEETEPSGIVSSRSEVRLRQMGPREARPEEIRIDKHQSGNQSSSSDFSLNSPAVLMKGLDDPMFVISFRSQKKIVTALAWKSAAMVCGGTASVLFGLYVLWARIALL
jgi:hypothetical protein